MMPPPLPLALAALFDVIRPLGVGGMGAVWLVRDRFLDRNVAIKVLLAEQTNIEQRERFLREARTSARLEHPHIIDVYRADETEGTVWFTMRFIDGESLGDRIRDRGVLPASDVVRILREVAWGLAYAHARGVVHRDIKPDNILIDRESGRAVLSDFGIAHDTQLAAGGLTMDGHVLGSVHYMSPEQVTGEPLDGRSDLYALGCVAFHALSGQVPFDGTPASVLVAHVQKAAPWLRDVAPVVPTSVCDVIARCLRKDPATRYPSADALASALDAALRDAEQEERAVADAAPGSLLTEREAQAVWQRAAQLQAEAAHRLERNAAITGAGTGTGVHQSAGTGTYRMRDVEAAAVDAGISRQYVALALAERQSPGGAPSPVVVLSERRDRQFTTMLGVTDRSISVSRVIPAGAKTTLAALGAVFTADPYRLSVSDSVNGHPLDGGVLRFAVPRLTAQAAGNPFAYLAKQNQLLYRLEQIELFDLSVTLQSRGTGQRPMCEVVITGDLREGLRRNLILDWAILSGAGTLTATGSAVALSGLMGSLALAALPGVALGAGAAGLSMVWYRWLFRSALAEAQSELAGLLAAVERHLTQRDLFSGEAKALSER